MTTKTPIKRYVGKHMEIKNGKGIIVDDEPIKAELTEEEEALFNSELPELNNSYEDSDDEDSSDEDFSDEDSDDEDFDDEELSDENSSDEDSGDEELSDEESPSDDGELDVEQEIEDALGLICQDNPFEVFIEGSTSENGGKLYPMVGFFNSKDDYQAAVSSIMKYCGKRNVFMTLNEFTLPKGKKKIPKYSLEVATKDSFCVTDRDITKYRYFYVDVDPVRKVAKDASQHVSASEEEVEAADRCKDKVVKYLSEEFSFPEPVVAFSGNGFHLLYKVKEFTATKQNIEKVKNALRAIAKKFNNDDVVIDTTVGNPARLVKVYGTIACKGQDCEERPHRVSYIINRPHQIALLKIEQIEELGKHAGGFIPTPAVTSNSDSEEENDASKWALAFMEEQGASVFTSNNNGKAYVRIPKSDIGSANYSIGDEDFLNYLVLEFTRAKKGKQLVHPKAFDPCIAYLKAVARAENVTKDVYMRIAKLKDGICYDLCDGKGNAVVITKEGVRVETFTSTELRNVIVVNTDIMAKQVFPIIEGNKADLPKLLRPLLNVKPQEQMLLIVTIVSWFIPDIARPILVLTGEQGSGKTMLSQTIQSIIDPLKVDVATIPKGVKDFVVALSHSYLTAFDNITSFTNDISNLLCQACTGGTYIKRKLYTDNDVSATNFKNTIILNGISDFIHAADLRDRIVEVELQPFDKGRATAQSIKEKLKESKPEILGAIFIILSKAMEIVDEVTLENPSRLADYERWGKAIAQVIYGDGDRFIEAYHANKGMVIDDSLASDAVAAALHQFLLGHESSLFPLKLNSTTIMKAVSANAEEEGYNTKDSYWPKDPAAFSKRIKKFAPCFKAKGITISWKREHSGRYIVFDILDSKSWDDDVKAAKQYTNVHSKSSLKS